MAEVAAQQSSPVSVNRIPDPEEPVPGLAVPAAGLLVGGLGLWALSLSMALTGAWPWAISVVLSTIGSYFLFTVSHDASHHSLSTSRAANTWMGRIATMFFAPQAGFRAWRFIHMQHHRYTNHHDLRDPDDYTNRGRAWQGPLRWATLDLYYMVFYLPKLRSRPRAEQVELGVTWLIGGGILAAAIATGHVVEYLVLYILPLRLNIFYLGWAFDYLPHHGIHVKPTEDRFRTTRLRAGRERLLTPILLYQNYHLVHHLHPLIPFHRYIAVWRRREEDYLAGDPELCDARGRPITPDEYRRLRALAEQH